MNAPAVLLVIRWLVRDTFRQARASGIFWIMLAISVLSIALCLSVRIEGDVPLTWDGPNRPEALPRSDVAKSAATVASLIADGAVRSQGHLRVPVPVYPLEYQQVSAALRQNVPLLNQGRLTLAFGANVLTFPSLGFSFSTAPSGGGFWWRGLRAAATRPTSAFSPNSFMWGRNSFR